LLSPRPDLSLSANFQSRAPLLGSPPVSRADAAPDFSGRSGAQLDRNAVLAGGAVGAVLAYAGGGPSVRPFLSSSSLLSGTFWLNGAAPESNRPSLGLPDRTGFEDRLGHRALPLRGRS
jgi:hypothetical protein